MQPCSEIYQNLKDLNSILPPLQMRQIEGMYDLLPSLNQKMLDNLTSALLHGTDNTTLSDTYKQLKQLFDNLSPKMSLYFEERINERCTRKNSRSKLTHLRSINTEPKFSIVDLTIPATLTTDSVALCRYLKSRLRCVSPAANNIAVVDSANAIHILGISTNRISSHEAQFKFGSDIPTACAFSYDGGTLAIGFNNDTIKILNLSTQKIGTVKYSSITSIISTRYFFVVTALNFSPNNRYLAAGGHDGTLNVWNAQNFEEEAWNFGIDDDAIHHDHAHAINCIAFSSDSGFMAASSRDGTICVRNNLDNSYSYLDGNHNKINAVAFSPDCSRLLSGSHAGDIAIWDLEEKKLVRTIVGLGSPVEQVAFSPHGKTILAYLSNGQIPMFTIEKNNLKEVLALYAFEQTLSKSNKQACQNLLNHPFFATLSSEIKSNLQARINKL